MQLCCIWGQHSAVESTIENVSLTVLSGVFISGTMTALNRSLKLAVLVDSTVLIILSGKVGLDHHLAEQAMDQAVVFNNGCICCSVRGALSRALQQM
jgi:G3E family GTPase